MNTFVQLVWIAACPCMLLPTIASSSPFAAWLTSHSFPRLLYFLPILFCLAILSAVCAPFPPQLLHQFLSWTSSQLQSRTKSAHQVSENKFNGMIGCSPSSGFVRDCSQPRWSCKKVVAKRCKAPWRRDFHDLLPSDTRSASFLADSPLSIDDNFVCLDPSYPKFNLVRISFLDFQPGFSLRVHWKIEQFPTSILGHHSRAPSHSSHLLAVNHSTTFQRRCLLSGRGWYSKNLSYKLVWSMSPMP